VLAFVLASVMTITTSAFGQSHTHTWYDGGSDVPDARFGHIAPTCQKTDEYNSPAESYKNLQYMGEEAQIIDKGDEVDAQGSDSVFRFFRTQKACKQFAIQLRAKIKAQQNEEQKPLNPYE